MYIIVQYGFLTKAGFQVTSMPKIMYDRRCYCYNPCRYFFVLLPINLGMCGPRVKFISLHIILTFRVLNMYAFINYPKICLVQLKKLTLYSLRHILT